MTDASRPPFPRRKLGAKLRSFREQAGLTLDEAAPKLDKKRSALHRIETGETKADIHFVRSVMDLYDCFDPDLLDEARQASKPPWYQAHGITNADYIDAETHAAEICQFLPIGIPELLHTDDYTTALSSSKCQRKAERDDHAEVLRIRRRRLTDESHPLTLVAVIHEAALRRAITGSKQLSHLIKVSALPNVKIHVIPDDHLGNDVPNSAFTLIRFPEPSDPDLLYVECPAGSLNIAKPTMVREAHRVFERLRMIALSPAESVALIEGLARHSGDPGTDKGRLLRE